jgi:thiamine biosynthesis lipoprotein
MNVVEQRLQHVEQVMGMAVSIDIRAPLPPFDDVRAMVRWLHHVDETFSTYRQESEISRLARGEIVLCDLSEEVEVVLRRCVELTSITRGAFDVFAVPAPNGTMLDPSGYVKGWCIEVAATMLEEAGAGNFCLNAGGDIALRGEPEPDQRWRVGIRHPELAHHQATVLQLAGRHAIATSATYERGVHIIEPATGLPVTELASVTVIGADLAIADAYATAVFVMGMAGLSWIEQQPGYEAYLITHEATTHWSPGFAAAWA